MRLFYFVTDEYPAWRVDLAELFSLELKRLGLQTDWSVRRENTGLWSSVKKNGEIYYLPLAINAVPFISPIVRRLGELLGEMWLMAKLVFGQHYEFIQVRDDRYTAALFAYLAARIRGSYFTYWLSYPFPENDLEKAQLATGIRQVIFRVRGELARWWLYQIVLPRADHVFVQTEHMKANMVAYGLDAKKMSAVPMGVSTRLFKWVATSKAIIEPNSLVYLGSFARSRRLELILEALAIVVGKIPSVKLYMVGRGDVPADRVFLETLTKQLNLTQHIEYTGFVPIEQAWKIAANAAVCISPIYPTFIFNQASPTKLYEYLALGRPVVANEHPDQSVTLMESGAGKSVQWDAHSFAQAIIYLLSHSEEAEAMARLGPQWVEDNRRYDYIAKTVFKQYKKMIES